MRSGPNAKVCSLAPIPNWQSPTSHLATYVSHLTGQIEPAEIAALEHKVARLSPPNPPAGQRPSGPRHGDPMKGLHDADAAVQHGGDREPDRLKPGGAPQASLEEYKRQLAELEERYQDALAKAREEGANEGAKGSQSTAPWWKVW